jgi:hypothetical protein
MEHVFIASDLDHCSVMTVSVKTRNDQELPPRAMADIKCPGAVTPASPAGTNKPFDKPFRKPLQVRVGSDGEQLGCSLDLTDARLEADCAGRDGSIESIRT